MRYLILWKILYSSEWNNARYLVLTYFLIYPSTLLKVICQGFSLYGMFYGVLYATYIKIFSHDFSFSKILSRGILLLIMSSK